MKILGHRKGAAGLLLLALCLLGACAAPSPAPTPTPTPTATPVPTPTLTPTPAPEEPEELWGFPIDDTHDAFEVPTGGKLGTVLVTVEAEGEDYYYHLKFSVWSADDLTAPIQKMEMESMLFHWYDVVDANFDGRMDFGYKYAFGTGGEFYEYWIWNETAGEFSAVPELSDYGAVNFDAESKTVVGSVNCGSAGLDGWNDIYRWEDGTPALVRTVRRAPWVEENDTIAVTLTVEDRVDGEMTEVFSGKYTDDTVWEELMKWFDLDYHGEEDG